jgi:hypothetical protein
MPCVPLAPRPSSAAPWQAQAACGAMKDRFIATCVALEETRLCAEKLLNLLDPEASSSPTMIHSAFLADGTRRLVLIRRRRRSLGSLCCVHPHWCPPSLSSLPCPSLPSPVPHSLFLGGGGPLFAQPP